MCQAEGIPPSNPSQHPIAAAPEALCRRARLRATATRTLDLGEAGGAGGGNRAAAAGAEGPRALAAVAALVGAVGADKVGTALATVRAVEVGHQLWDVGAVVVAPLVVQVLAAVA